MAKPILYVALEGPVLVPGKKPDPLLKEYQVAEYAKPFMHWAKDHFDVRWLTEHSPRVAFYVSDQLGLRKDAVPVAGYGLSKTEVLEPHDDFYWVDSELIPSEVSWLAQHGHLDRFISVDPNHGVTPGHRKELESALRRKRK